MCGIFGFISTRGQGPSIDRLAAIARATQERGPDAFGLAWIDGEGGLHAFKRPGPATENLADLERCDNALAVIGHCRWATHGLPEDNENNHPHRAGSGWYVHNGVICNHQELQRAYGLRTKTECDSEVLGLLMAHAGGDLRRRSVWAANQAAGNLAVLGLWPDPARLLILRRGRPLHFGHNQGGYYFGSLPAALPGRVWVLLDNIARVMTFQSAGPSMVGCPLARG